MKTLDNTELTDFSMLLRNMTGKGLTVSRVTYSKLGTFGVEYTLNGKKVFAGPYRSKDQISNPKDIADAVASIVLNKKLQNGVFLLP
jgi:hypothetical protein